MIRHLGTARDIGLVSLAAAALAVAASFTTGAEASGACTPTGYVRDGINLSAALINPSGTVTGDVDARGCNIGVYYDEGEGSVSEAEIHGANYFGVVVNAATNDVAVDIENSHIYDIAETPLNGSQHGVGIYYAAYESSTASGTVRGNQIEGYQKGGIVANGHNVSVSISNNEILGQGPVGYIAQNGIQVGYGADAKIMRNFVAGNSYTGTSTVSAGILIIGGPYFGYPYTTGTQIVGNTLENNDIGVYLNNVDADGAAPATQTNISVVNNVIGSDSLQNNYAGAGYQAGVADEGNNDKIINNSISGDGYSAEANPGAFTVEIDADPSFTNGAKVHAND